MSIRRISSVFALGLLAYCFGSGRATAATAAASFGVTATVQASCLASLRPDHAGTTSATSAVSVACSHPVSYDVRVFAERSARPPLISMVRAGSDRAVAWWAQLPTLT